MCKCYSKKNRDLWSETMYLILPHSPNKTQLTLSSAKIRKTLFCCLKRPLHSVLSEKILFPFVGVLHNRAKFELRRCRIHNFLMIINFKDRGRTYITRRSQLGNWLW